MKALKNLNSDLGYPITPYYPPLIDRNGQREETGLIACLKAVFGKHREIPALPKDKKGFEVVIKAGEYLVVVKKRSSPKKATKQLADNG